MKLVLALAVLATSAASVAASRDIYDIMYLPNAGTTYGFSEASLLSGETEGKNGLGDTETDGFTLNQTIGHALTDRLSLQASIGYAELEADPDGGSKVEQSGISDPTISARFRVMDEAYRFDIIGGALISIMDSEQERNGDTDNLQGGHALFAGAQFGQKTESFQWAVLGQFTYNMERTVETSAKDIDIDQNNELLVRGDILNKLAEKSLLRSFVSVDFSEILESDDLSPKTVQAPSTAYAIGTEYQHLISKDLLARVGVDYTMINQDSAYVDSDTAWNFNIGANYQF